MQAALGDEFVFAGERHAAVLEALGPPVEAAGWGYQYLLEDPEGFEGGPVTQLPAPTELGDRRHGGGVRPARSR